MLFDGIRFGRIFLVIKRSLAQCEWQKTLTAQCCSGHKNRWENNGVRMSWGLRNSSCRNRCLPNRQDMSRNRQRGCMFRRSCNCSFSCIANHICRTGIELDTAKKHHKRTLDLVVSSVIIQGFDNLDFQVYSNDLFCIQNRFRNHNMVY